MHVVIAAAAMVTCGRFLDPRKGMTIVNLKMARFLLKCTD